MKLKWLTRYASLCFLILAVFSGALPAQDSQSIGGKEHDANLLGVEIGMDVTTALKTAFINSKRKPGQERPDAKRNEGKNGRDVRVVYKDLAQGELQIVFADGKYVKEMVLIYASPPMIDDLRLPFTGSLGNSRGLVTTSTVAATPAGAERGELSTNTTALDGTKPIDGFNAGSVGNTERSRGEAIEGARYDDRYTIGFNDRQKLQRIWWRDEKTTGKFTIRVQFVSEKITKAGANLVVRLSQKAVFLMPDEEKLFRKVLNLPE